MSQKESEWELELRDMIDGIAAYKHDVGDRAVLLVKKVISNREKEIAEEVEEMLYNRPQWAFSKDAIDALKQVLQILKH